MLKKPGRAVALGNTAELLQALVEGRKEVRNVFLELDKCFEEGADQLRANSEIDDELLSMMAIHIGELEHASQVLLAHIAGYKGDEGERQEDGKREEPGKP